MYDKTNRPPEMGSLQEALFLTIWMRRQEVELHKARILALGLAQIAEDGDILKVYQSLSETVFPFLKTHTAKSDQEMVARMKKEVSKGPIGFNEVSLSPLKKRAAALQIPEELRQRLHKKKSLTAAGTIP